MSYLTVENVADYFDNVEPEGEDLLGVFNVRLKDGTQIGIKDFFKGYYADHLCRYTDETQAKNVFRLIFYDNLFLLAKIAKERDMLQEIVNIEKNWFNFSETTSSSHNLNINNTTNTLGTTVTDKRGGKIGQLIGKGDASAIDTDASELLDPTGTKVMGYLDPKTREREQNITLEGGQNEIINSGTDRGDMFNYAYYSHKNTSKTSNAANDYINFLRLKLPKLREDYLSRFKPMFFYV